MPRTIRWSYPSRRRDRRSSTRVPVYPTAAARSAEPYPVIVTRPRGCREWPGQGTRISRHQTGAGRTRYLPSDGTGHRIPPCPVIRNTLTEAGVSTVSVRYGLFCRFPGSQLTFGSVTYHSSTFLWVGLRQTDTHYFDPLVGLNRNAFGKPARCSSWGVQCFAELGRSEAPTPG